MPPYGGIPFEDLCRSRTRLRASQAFRLLGPGSPVIVPDSVALGQLSKPLGAQPLNPWIVKGSVPFLSHFSEPPSASLGCLFSFWVQEEPPSLYTEREDGQEFP